MNVSELKKIHTAAEAGENTQLRFTVDGTEYVRRFRPAERLILLGCGHIGQALCRYAADLGFSVTAVDERPGFANSMQMPEAECFSTRNLYYMRYFFELYANAVILPQVGAKSDQTDFSSARRRTTRWSSGRLSRRNSQSVFPNTASARFCQKRLQVTFRVLPTLNPQSAV